MDPTDLRVARLERRLFRTQAAGAALLLLGAPSLILEGNDGNVFKAPVE